MNDMTKLKIIDYLTDMEAIKDLYKQKLITKSKVDILIDNMKLKYKMNDIDLMKLKKAIGYDDMK